MAREDAQPFSERWILLMFPLTPGCFPSSCVIFNYLHSLQKTQVLTCSAAQTGTPTHKNAEGHTGR